MTTIAEIVATFAAQQPEPAQALRSAVHGWPDASESEAIKGAVRAAGLTVGYSEMSKECRNGWERYEQASDTATRADGTRKRCRSLLSDLVQRFVEGAAKFRHALPASPFRYRR